MAKIAVQSSLSSQFASKYAGKVRIDAARISRAASQTPYFSGTASTGAMSYAHSQNAEAFGDRYDDLFYLFENGSLAAGRRVLLTLDATYDRDGRSGSADLRGRTRGQVSLDGLIGADIMATITVADWETPTTQTIDIGA